MIDDKKFNLIHSFHTYFPYTNEILIPILKNNINVSLYSSSNIVVTVSGEDLNPVHRLNPIVGHFHYTINLSSPYTDINITIHKSRLKRLWYCMIFKNYHPLIYKFRLKNESLNLLDS